MVCPRGGKEKRKMKIKGFDKDLKCRGFQFEIGKEYKIENNGKKLSLCSNTVFHYCDSLKKVHSYYSASEENRFCEIEVLGEEVTDGEKCGSNHIKILREITGEELKTLKGMTNGNTGLFNSGNSNSGDFNSGDSNSGNRNSGNRNSGNSNSGCFNSGNRNSGDFNSGDWNSGDFNSGCFNSGCFNTTDEKIRFFNKKSQWAHGDWILSEARRILNKIPKKVVEWIDKKNMTEEEKELNPTYEATGGYLKELDEKDSSQIYWESLSEEEKEVVKSLPNFDAEIFKECTGIDIFK